MDKYIAHILVVDDDDGIRSLVKKYLNENNFLVTTANSAEDASEKISIIKFDLIILDIMMPGKNGLEFIKDHKKKLDTPIILLTAKGEANERVEGLETGADDYLPKPFEPKELILRIKNILDKTLKTEQVRIIEFANVKIDLNKLLIHKNDKEFKINNTEKIILEKMINNPGKTFSREDIGQLIELDKERSIDVIKKQIVDDIDLATNLKPSEVCDALKKKEINYYETGIEHGTVTAIIDNNKYEITSLRKDISTDGRHAKVEFSIDWKKDAARRDFSINSIYSDKDGNLFDPY
ncbi:response regulator, partial [Candidatus Pelagibacter bacterium]|nr:response regulator [Candidatus Pelagibacter bacterium]